MASLSKQDNSDDLNESWVELQQNSLSTQIDPELPRSQSAYNGNFEKLLQEAQRESRTPSRPNSKESSTRTSPKNPGSPTNEWVSGSWREKQDPGTDWIWDWSSRPEILPNSDWNGKFKHPGAKPIKHTLSVRHSKAMKKGGIFNFENIPTLLLTHACTFFLGAAVMFVYVKKYCTGWTMVSLD
ncbi:hypothetical protein LOTGIDRAFT_205439 [Lottia gigantea]|uniref:BCL2/adenovirus E1B 19 kDa protein-interacting protein 3 n=1 Tax=Lottia gigantea TaxID=225164 RepID=V4BZU9_LOTGI|nr:hypothetical protein LOTGIDRAFT_205439 [Lottia gigantea]ESO94689.1 hypothetical protein LOTGIDRAFT_205439 [Lottia gigantea]